MATVESNSTASPTVDAAPGATAYELGVLAEELPGRLIIVEGIDGSGKSTQIDLLYKWLVGQGYLTVFTEWNSSPIVRGTTRRGKRRQLLTPMSFSLIHAADFANRVYSEVLPAMRAGAVVLADRYVYTAFARDGARGVPAEWLRRLYSFAVTPTLALYFDVPLSEALHRIATSRATIKFYEAGMDLGLSDDLFESFRLFQGRILGEYEQLRSEFDLTRIDATETLVRQQQQVRALVAPHLAGVQRLEGGDIQQALRLSGLAGRYVDPPVLRSGGEA
jgi:dTMP kinase